MVSCRHIKLILSLKHKVVKMLEWWMENWRSQFSICEIQTKIEIAVLVLVIQIIQCNGEEDLEGVPACPQESTATGNGVMHSLRYIQIPSSLLFCYSTHSVSVPQSLLLLLLLLFFFTRPIKNNFKLLSLSLQQLVWVGLDQWFRLSRPLSQTSIYITPSIFYLIASLPTPHNYNVVN